MIPLDSGLFSWTMISLLRVILQFSLKQRNTMKDKITWARYFGCLQINLYSNKVPLMEKPGDYYPLAKCVKVNTGRLIY